MSKTLLTLFLLLCGVCGYAATDANGASQIELARIRSVGPVLAQKIVGERKKGSFSDWKNFVSRVPGMQEATAIKLSAAGLTVGGALFTGFAAQQGREDALAQARDKARQKSEEAEGARVLQQTEHMVTPGARDGRRR